MQDLKHAIRLQLKKPRFAAVAIFTLALGIGANTAIFSLVNAVLIKGLPFPKEEQLFLLNEREAAVLKPVAYLNFIDWQKMNKSYQDMACFRPSSSVVLSSSGAELVSAKAVSSNFFRTLGVQPECGRAFTPEEDAVGAVPVTVVTSQLARQYFGEPQQALGKNLNLEGTSHTIVGVVPDNLLLFGETQLYLPIHPLAHSEPRFNHDSLSVVARLKDGVRPETAKAEMDLIVRQLEKQYPKDNARETVEISSLKERLTADTGRLSLVLLCAVGFVLLIACVNVANLLLARLNERQKEFAVRIAVGASARQLMRQSLVESLLLALEGAVLGLLLAEPLLTTLSVLVPSEMAPFVAIDSSVMLFSLGLSCVTALLFGFVPALGLARLTPGDSLKARENAGLGVRHDRIRSLLVVSQVALALVLLVGAGLMLRTMVRLIRSDLGFRPEGVVTMKIKSPETRFLAESQSDKGFDLARFMSRLNNYNKEILARVEAIPGVQSAAMTYPLPMTGATARMDIEVPGLASQSSLPVPHRYAVSPDYFKVMGIRLIQGRGFERRDDSGQPLVAVVNQKMASMYWPNGQAIGRQFRVPRLKDLGPWTIVGVVADCKHGLHEPPPPQLYLSSMQWPSTITLAIRSSLPADQLAASIRRQVARFDPEAPVHDVKTMEDRMSQAMAHSRHIATLLAVFAGLALALASIGIYGMMAHSVAQRSREIGIRMALGASSANVLRTILGKALAVASIGAGIGLVASFALTKSLSGWLEGVTTTDPVTYAAVSLMLIGVAVFAAFWPARKAASTDPMSVLRSE